MIVVRPPAGSVPRLQVTTPPATVHGVMAGGLNVAEVMVKAPLLTCVSVTDRKSTRLNSSHLVISYAVFCLKKKKPATSERIAVVAALVFVPRSGLPAAG